jgi:hypothetical protein
LKLVELMQRLSYQPSTVYRGYYDTIYASEDPYWMPESEAIILRHYDDDYMPADSETNDVIPMAYSKEAASGLSYLLEVGVAQEAIDMLWLDMRTDTKPDPITASLYIIWYATHS